MPFKRDLQHYVGLGLGLFQHLRYNTFLSCTISVFRFGSIASLHLIFVLSGFGLH